MIVGTGSTEEKATTKCIQNVIELMNGYNQDKVEELVSQSK